MSKEKEGMVESLGRIIGYCYLLPISFIGMALIIYGISGGHRISTLEIIRNAPLPGSGLFYGLCILSGALLQIFKNFRRRN